MEEICSFWEVLINDPLSLVTITSYRDVLKIIGLTIATSSISYFIIKWISNKIKKLILFLHARSKKVRSNVLLLYPEINKIEIVLHQDKDLFFFKSPSIEQDYESRDTNLNHEEIKTLWDEIQKRLNDAQKNVSSLDCARDKKIYSLIEQLKEIYNITTLTEAIYKINKERRVDTKIGFIGDKYGVWNFELRKDKWGSLYKRSIEEEKPTLCLSVYRTDHFAWHVFKYIYERNREFFKQLIDIIPQTNSKQKCAVLQALSFLFSSIGADVILHGRNGKYHNCFVQGLRSSNVEKDGVPRFHVPVNETLTTTDFNGQGNPTDARDWITRGIEEEVGLNYRELNEKNVDINYHDFSIIYDKGEIGFSCDVGINKINLDKLLFLGPIDRYLESDGIFVIPYRKSGFIHMLIKLIFIEYIVPKKIGITNQVEWSFTAPIYQRFFVRQWALTFGYFRYLIVVGVIIFLCIFFNDCIGVLAPFLFTFLLSCGKFWKQKIDFKHSDNKVRYLAPFIPTNVADYIPSQELKVLQTTGKSYINRNDDPVAEGLFLRIKGYEKKITLNLKDLAVSPDPMCCIRRKDNDKEFPISFYNLEKSQPGVMQCKLYFMYFDIYFSLEHPENNIIFFQKEESGKITFAKLIDDIELSFCKPETIKNLDLDEELYRIYFRDNSEQFNNFLLAKFPNTFSYKLCDFIKCKKNYYWSCISKENINLSNNRNDKCKLSDLSEFIQRNLKYISEVELLALQFILSRYNVYLTSKKKINRSYIIRYFRVHIGKYCHIGIKTKIGKGSKLMDNVTIGKYSIIGENVKIHSHVVIGSNVVIQNGVEIPTGVIIEDGVLIESNVSFCEDVNRRAASYDGKNFRLKKHGYWDVKVTRISKGATIGMGAVIVCGNTIGEFVTIYPNVIILQDIPNNAVVMNKPVDIIQSK